MITLAGVGVAGVVANVGSASSSTNHGLPRLRLECVNERVELNTIVLFGINRDIMKTGK